MKLQAHRLSEIAVGSTATCLAEGQQRLGLKARLGGLIIIGGASTPEASGNDNAELSAAASCRCNCKITVCLCLEYGGPGLACR